MLVFLTGLSYCIASLVINVQHYLQYPKSIDVGMTTENHKAFPSVTICNMNSFRYTMGQNQIVLRHRIIHFPMSEGVSEVSE